MSEIGAPKRNPPDHSPLRADLVAYACRLSGNRDDGEDMAQEAFLRLYTAERPPGNTWGYMMRTVERLWIDRLRDRLRKPVVPMEDVLEVSAAYADPLEAAVVRQQLETFQVLLATLPQEHQAAIRLAFVHQWGSPEIAARTGLKADHVRQIVRRFRTRCKRILGDAA
jgi:RNA polymerase sigma factor (sigma-70 family)